MRITRWLLLAVMTLGCLSVGSQPVKVGSFLQEKAEHFFTEQGLPSNDINDLWIDAGRPVVATAAGNAKFNGNTWEVVELKGGASYALSPTGDAYQLESMEAGRKDVQIPVHQATDRSTAPAAVATAQGLFVRNATGLYEKLDVRDGLGRMWGVEDVRGVALDAQGKLWFATLAGAAVQGDSDWNFFTGEEGLPFNDFTCMAAGQDGAVWFGTTRGVVRYKDGKWRYRQGRRWLPHDEVRSIAVDGDHGVWVATAGGVGHIFYTPMTLKEKAAIYEEQTDLIKRTEYGYVSELLLMNPGDTRETRFTDSDNDGLWTAMYGAAECFAYAATKTPEAKARATRAFKALEFLQKVPQLSEERPPKGYVARTILPGDGHDPNIGRIERDLKHREHEDYLWKIYEPRWPKTTDGKWYWKSDTSSDELDGHYFLYPAYYDYVAETEAEKEAVREVVRALTDHLLEYGFNLVDHDGTPTRWAIYNPDTLNQDMDWWPERGLKSMSILSYLAVAEHITGDPKYGEASRELIEKHHFLTNSMFYKIHFGPGSGNQSDDEMAFMNFYNLMKYSKDEQILPQIMYSFHSAWINEEPEMNPLFNFMFAVFSGKITYPLPWGDFEIKAWDNCIEDAVETLIEFPLDRFNWSHENSHRLDLRILPPQQAAEPYEEICRSRGYRVNGKVLPVSERYFNHWNTDPWRLDYGGDGRVLGNGTVFLLPYYMGLYHGFIEE